MESNLFSTEGRIRRSTYWARMIVVNAIYILARVMAIEDPSAAFVCLIVMLIALIFSFIQSVKRMHDVGKRGWYAIIPIYGLILSFTDGTSGDNEYGENPKEKNPQEDELYNGIMNLLFSAFVTCGIYALLTITKIINAETIKNVIFIISFTACNWYLMTWKISKTDKSLPSKGSLSN